MQSLMQNLERLALHLSKLGLINLIQYLLFAPVAVLLFLEFQDFCHNFCHFLLMCNKGLLNGLEVHIALTHHNPVKGGTVWKILEIKAWS